ncbi:MAG: hypothetical protein Q4P72_06135 [Eubacteriales bacterium]|nr:hypothetical protein [Eubacteriales bacterium]
MFDIKERIHQYKTRPRKYLSAKQIRTTLEETALLDVYGVDEQGFVKRENGLFKIYAVQGIDLYLLSDSQRETVYSAYASVLSTVKTPLKIISMYDNGDFGDEIAFVKKKIETQSNDNLRSVLETSLMDYEFYEKETQVRCLYLFIYGETADEITAIRERFNRLETVGIRLRELNKQASERVLYKWIQGGA